MQTEVKDSQLTLSFASSCTIIKGSLMAEPRNFKRDAAAAALDYVASGMRLGIGTGSTAEEFVRLLAEKVARGFDVIGVPTSERTAKLCNELGVRLATLENLPELDLTIDGADELDADLNLIKGGGGALLREKIVAAASARMIVIADASKKVATLGAFPLPIEVNQFGLRSTQIAIKRVSQALHLNGPIVLRGGEGQPFLTDGGHVLLDASFGLIPAPLELQNILMQIPGVVETGLFIGLCDTALIASDSGIEIVTTRL
jgi:ribose 5-phosphate isomerase A